MMLGLSAPDGPEHKARLAKPEIKQDHRKRGFLFIASWKDMKSVQTLKILSPGYRPGFL
jgi:hypothetical protein